MKFQVTVEIEVNTDNEEQAQVITSEMDYSFSFIAWESNMELITSTVIKDVEFL